MSGFKFSTVDVLLVEHDTVARESLRMILRNEGFRQIRIGVSLSDIENCLKHKALDLIITGVDFPGGSVCSIVSAMRNHEIGDNPFLPVIAITENPSSQLVREVIDSGADDLLIRPLSTTALVERIDTLVDARKPFVVTSDYIGPDRRKTADRPSNVPLVDVPNTMAAKVNGEPIPEIDDLIEETITEINEQKLDRHITQFHWLSDAMKGEFAKQGASDTFVDHLMRLAFVAQDAARRVEGTAHAHIADLCQSMIELSARSQENCKSDDAAKAVPRDLAVIAHMATAIQAGFTTGSEAAAREIMEEISE
ncbi:MAG: response regulator [Rhodospirillales bacterium]|nr:response regulator [Rhodospirillales bacterium]